MANVHWSQFFQKRQVVSVSPANRDVQNRIIETVERELITLAKKKNLYDASVATTVRVEKYRWEAEDVTLWWRSLDGIEKIIHCDLRTTFGNHVLVVGVNAWKDDRSTLTRKGTYLSMKPVGDFDAQNPAKLRILQRRLERAYALASSLKESDLTTTTSIRPIL